MKKILLAVLVSIGVTTFFASPVFAHVLVTDNASGSSAILHISPDDDPEAGKEASLYFDIQSKIDKSTFGNYLLYITNDQNKTNIAPVEANGNGISAHYTFPTQSLYKLELKSPNPTGASMDLRYSLRVSRGIAGDASQAPKHSWTTPLTIAALAGLGLLSILFVNNANDIFKKSTF